MLTKLRDCLDRDTYASLFPLTHSRSSGLLLARAASSVNKRMFDPRAAVNSSTASSIWSTRSGVVFSISTARPPTTRPASRESIATSWRFAGRSRPDRTAAHAGDQRPLKSEGNQRTERLREPGAGHVRHVPQSHGARAAHCLEHGKGGCGGSAF